MKKTASLVSLAALCAAAPLVATADDEILPEEKRDGYVLIDVWYSQFDKHGFDLSGGGFRVGGEIVDPSLLLGIGGRFGMGIYFGSDKTERSGSAVFTHEDPMAIDFPLDAYVPFRVSEFVTVYGGVGATFFTESADFRGTMHNGRRYIEQKGTVETKGLPVLFAAFVGIRLRYENVFGFVEYRNDFKKDVKFKRTYDYYSVPDDEWESEMGCGRIFVGLGVEFGK